MFNRLILSTKVTTGIDGLDEIVEGGLPRPAAIGLIGEADSGKSLLARQISWNLLRKGFNVLYYSVDESAEDVRRCMNYYGWDITEYEREGKFHFIDIFSHGAEVIKTYPAASPSEYIDQIFDFNGLLKEDQDLYLEKMGGKDLLVIIDSLDSLIFLLDKEEALYFLRGMKSITRASQCIGIAIVNLDTHDPKLEEPYKQIVDVIIELHKIGQKGNRSRCIRVTKAPERFHDESYYFEIDEKHGITVHQITVPLIEEIA